MRKETYMIVGMILLVITGCMILWYRGEKTELTDTKSSEEDLEQEIQNESEKIAELYRDIYEKAVENNTIKDLKTIQEIVDILGKAGYTAVDTDNEINMVNPEKAEVFCENTKGKQEDELTIFSVTKNGGFIRYDFRTSNGKVTVLYTVFVWEKGELKMNYNRSFTAHTWIYSEKGYLFFEEYHPEGYDGASGYIAIRIKPLDEKCRDLNRKYVEPVGYGLNKLLITNWTETAYGTLDFYDLFELLYEIHYGKKCPYEFTYDKKYKIPQSEFEEVFMSYFQMDSFTLQQYTDFLQEEEVYLYRPRGMYDLSTVSEIPCPEVTEYQENEDGTLTLTVNAIWPQKSLDCAFASQLTVRPMWDGSFLYVSNHVIDSDRNVEPSWYTERLTDEEWDKYYASAENIEKEKGYDLPLETEQKEEAESDCLANMKLIEDLYQNADKGQAANAVLSKESIREMAEVLAETGQCVSVCTFPYSMFHYEKMDVFLKSAKAGETSGETVYEVQEDGGICRRQFHYEKEQMCVLTSVGMWGENGAPMIIKTSLDDVEQWMYTEKGWLFYSLCVPSAPEVTEVVNGAHMMRILPGNGEYAEMAEKWLLPIGYQGNNLFSSQWNEENMEDLDYNGLYEYLYELEFQKKYDYGQYPDGIPKEEFENLVTKYLPVSKEQLQKYAVYDEEKNTYKYAKLGIGNFYRDAYGYSVPDITCIKENGDGTVTITVDAVCEMLGSDKVFSHEVRFCFLENGGIKYMGNRILDDNKERIPEYKYRLEKE